MVMVKAALTAIDRDAVSDNVNESVTRTVKFEVPVLVGVPEMVPVGLSARFAGSDPEETLQTSDPMPPSALKVSL